VVGNLRSFPLDFVQKTPVKDYYIICRDELGSFKRSKSMRSLERKNRMLFLSVIFIFLSHFTVHSSTKASDIRVEKDHDSADPIIIEKNFELSEFAGQYVFLVFTSRYCKICAKTMMNLNRLFDKYKSSGLVVVGIYTDKIIDKKAVLEFATEKKISFPLVVGNTHLVNDHNVNFLPTVLLINTKGKVAKRYSGNKSYNRFKDDFEKMKNRAQ
jgi:peroxiredoxin